MDKPAAFIRKPAQDFRVSFVMPAYNEVENIAEAVEKAVAALRNYTVEYEVIVVNDGSSDGTAELLDSLAKEEPALRPIHHETNKGYGAALKSGFTSARHDLVFYTDADNQFDVDEIKFLLPMSEKYDIVTGFRIYRYDPVIRSILSWGFNKMCRILFGIRVRDVDCAFKLFKRKVFDSFEMESKDFFIDAEILSKARARGFSINEIGVKHFPRRAGRATVRSSDIPRTLKELLHIWISIHTKKGGGKSA